MSYQVLTVEALTSGIEGGSWIAIQDFDLNVDIKIRKAQITCLGNGFKITSREESEIKLQESFLTINFEKIGSKLLAESCHFANSSMEINNYASVNFISCTFKRSFPLDDEHPAYLSLSASDEYSTIEKCTFELENIPLIDIDNESYYLTIENSQFIKCGNPKGNGVINSDVIISINNSTFKQCVAKEENAIIRITIDYRGSKGPIITNSQFVDCHNQEITSEQWQELAKKSPVLRFVSHNDKHYDPITLIDNSQFTNSGLNLSSFDQKSSSDKTYLTNCQFKNAPIIAHKDTHLTTNNCQFDNAGKENIITVG